MAAAPPPAPPRATLPPLDHATAADWARVYEPAEDTYLLCDALAADAPALRAHGGPALVVELGPGSGAVSACLLDLLRGAGGAAPATLALAADVSAPACALPLATARAAGVGARLDALQADLLCGARGRLAGAVDVLLFNPPYGPTPADEVPRAAAFLAAGADTLPGAWAGGARGRAVVDRALPLFAALLARPHGAGYLLLVEENAPAEVVDALAALGLAAVVAARARARNERLCVLRITWPAAEAVGGGGGAAEAQAP